MALKFNPVTGQLDVVLDKASEIKFTPAGTLVSTDVQDALEELDADITALPDPITYQGTWSAATNTPTLANTDTGVTGYLYQVNAAGSVNFGAGAISFEIGDKVVNNGTIWEKWDMTDSVTSVNGQNGVVVLDTGDIAEDGNLYFTDERAQDAVGGIVANSSKVSLSYLDATPSITADIVAGSLVNADVNASAAIAYSKLNLATSIVNADVNASAAIAYSKLNLANSIVNADVASGAAVAVNKLAAVTASRALVSDGSGFISPATTTSTEIGYVNGVTSAIQTQLDAKQARSTLTNKGDLYVATASATVARQGVGTDGQFLKADSGTTNGIVWASAVSTAATVSKTGTYTAAAGDDVILCNSSGGTFAINLPTAVGISGKMYTVKKTDSSVIAVTIEPDGTETIDGVTNTTINTQGETLRFISDGANWQILERHIPSNWISFTPTSSFVTNATFTGKWRRVGDSMEFAAYASFAGTTSAATFTVTLPLSLTIDTAKLAGGGATDDSYLSAVIARDAGVSNYTGVCKWESSTQVRVITTTSGIWSNTVPFTFNNGDFLSLTCVVPISGWNG